MATEAEIISRVRLELGDQPEPFRQTYRGTGEQDEFDLPSARIIKKDLKVFITDPETLINTELQFDVGYFLDAANGVVRTSVYPVKNALITVEGTAYGLFSDEDLSTFAHEATMQHTFSQTNTIRYRDENGFIKYDVTSKSLASLSDVEAPLVAYLATVEALWALATDASTDIDVVTSEGTHISRSQRFQQLQVQIANLTDKYQTLSQQLGVGLFRMEVGNLRRVSRTTNRLVPLYVEREYDDHQMPIRIITEIDQRGADPDGPPSPGAMFGIY